MLGLCLHRRAQYRKTRTYILATNEISTQDPNVREVQKHTRLRTRGQWDHLMLVLRLRLKFILNKLFTVMWI